MTDIVVCLVVGSPACIQEIMGSILDLETRYLGSEFLWQSSVLPGECWHETLKLVLIVSALSILLFLLVFLFNICVDQKAHILSITVL